MNVMVGGRCWFTSLPGEIVHYVVDQFLDIKNIGRLDSSLCSAATRAPFLTALRERPLCPELTVYLHCEVIRFVKWIIKRRIYVQWRKKQQPSSFLPRYTLQTMSMSARLVEEDDLVALRVACRCFANMSANELNWSGFPVRVVQRVVEILQTSDDFHLLMFTSITVMNLSLQGERRIQELLDLGLLPALLKLHARDHHQLKKNALQATSYLTIGNRAQIELVLGTGLVPKILDLSYDPDQDKALNAAVVDMIFYIVSLCSFEHTSYLITHNAGAILCRSFMNTCYTFRVMKRAMYTLVKIDNQTIGKPVGHSFKAQLTPACLRMVEDIYDDEHEENFVAFDIFLSHF